MISFNIPPFIGRELTYVEEAIRSRKICGDGEFTRKCSGWLEKHTQSGKVLLTTSCTHATEMAAILANIQPGDEVIMPSYTFVSTANAFVLRGAKVIFVDIRPESMNIDERLIENAITKKTKAIVPVHYAGVSCKMDEICKIAEKYSLYVIEDAAQGMMSSYKGRALGAIGDFGCFSFHETKNYSMGECGALLLKNEKDFLNAEIIREKGTNRSQFFRKEISKYTWMEAGSSYLPSELNAAYLWAQLERSTEIYNDRMASWNLYYELLKELEIKGMIECPNIPDDCIHNAHMFYIKLKNMEERTMLIHYLRGKNICAVFHYIPLHTSPAGKRFGEFCGKDQYTTKESERLLRLPLYYGLKADEVKYVVKSIYDYYKYSKQIE